MQMTCPNRKDGNRDILKQKRGLVEKILPIGDK